MAVEHKPLTMRALMYDQPRQTLELVTSCPVPEPDFEKDEHLLRVYSTAITRHELLWPFPPEVFKNYSPGIEMCGVVVACPPGSQFPIGTDVYMRTNSPRSGSAREFVTALGKELARRPRNLTAEQAASVPGSALTAWQVLFVQAGYSPVFHESQSHPALERRKKILIIGASGSVGLWTTQLASAAGFWVAGTCQTRNIAHVRAMGAHEIIDYTDTSVRDWMQSNRMLQKFDLVLDCVVGGGSAECWHAAHPDHGLFLSIVPPADMVLKWTLKRPEGISAGVQGRFFIMESNGEHLQKITELIESGKVKPVVDSIFGLKDYENAFQRVDSGEAVGKVVLQVQHEKNTSGKSRMASQQ